MMKKIPILIVIFVCTNVCSVRCQDTFSILAFDSITREVGAAGASCLDLFATPFSNNDFICELFPDTGAIDCQAAYIAPNQATARQRMRAGDSPAQIISYLIANDAGGPATAFTTRQYGVVRMGSNPRTAAFTGTACMNYKNHIVGPNYTIQGNILLGQMVLDSMEARFKRAHGDLACKLMAAMQGAKMVGADSRCAGNNTSSMFAFLKVSLPTDTFGKPRYLISLRTHNGDQIEPIDSLQVLFNNSGRSCSPPNPAGIRAEQQQLRVNVFPNPASHDVQIAINSDQSYRVRVYESGGRLLYDGTVTGKVILDSRRWNKGLYTCELSGNSGIIVKKFVIE
jgi:uncharacterized Ntn-hydrolase superfamily protein